ncbi:MAG: sugar phosphate isomerase/epimerase [Phycisphaeraceae bacterium]
MSITRTGGFGIGFRKGWSNWQKDAVGLAKWAGDNDFACIDVGGDVEQVRQFQQAGAVVVSADLAQSWKDLICTDTAKRDAALAVNRQHIQACAALGVKVFFLVMLPADPAAKRADNFKLMVEAFAGLMPTLEQTGTQLAIEGWPGPGALCCTPETYRAFFKEVPSKANGINYDPSHLVRLGVDYLRFLDEFADRVVHVHGKDTELLSERLYELGNEQPATFAAGIGFGGNGWRYTLPGHGVIRWGAICQRLKQAGYKGKVCIELEDANFNGTEEGEKAGLIFARRFLEGC